MSENQPPLLAIKNLQVHYGAIQALKGVSIEVGAGEVVALIGSNGAGKTTLLKTISGLLRPAAGEIWFEGKPLPPDNPRASVALGIAHVPEGRGIFATLSVKENLLIGAHLRHDLRGVRDDLKKIYELFPLLEERRHQPALTLSGGEQQMLAIGRGLMSKPRLLILDEPSLGLAPIMVQKIFGIIETLHAQGTTILLVEQNAHLALAVADRGYVIETGTIVATNRAAALLNDPAVKEAYLGDHV